MLFRETVAVYCANHNSCGTCDQILLSVRRLLSESCCLVSVGRPLWREVGSVICHSQSIVSYQYLHQLITLHVFYSWAIYIQGFIQSRLSTVDYALLVTTSSNYRRSLDTWTVVQMTATKFKPFVFSHFQIIIKNSVSMSPETRYVSATESNRFMLFSETVAVYCEIHVEYTGALCGQNVEF
jgi:hypothetical protein